MSAEQGQGEQREPARVNVPVDIWNCAKLKALINKQIEAHVTDVDLRQKLEHALGNEVAYGDGGGGNVGVA